MALPPLHGFCQTNAVSTRLCITMPGGAEVCAQFPAARVPDPSELIAALFGNLSAALAPLAPIFSIIEVLIAIVDCLKAVQKAIASFPPRPDKLLSCFPKLARALGKVLSLLPPLTIPVMIGNFLDALLTFLAGIRNQLLAIIRKTLKILIASTSAASLPSLQLGVIVDCAQGDLDLYMANLNANAGPLARMLSFVNELLSLAGMDPLPQVNLRSQAADAIAPLDETITVLQKIRLFFP